MYTSGGISVEMPRLWGLLLRKARMNSGPASQRTKKKRSVLQGGRKRLAGEAVALFRRGSFPSSSTGMLFALEPIKIQSVFFFFCQAFSFKMDSCCYCIYTSFWQSKEMFLLKETMTCMIGLDIGSHTVIPEALTLFRVNKSNGCRSCRRNFI